MKKLVKFTLFVLLALAIAVACIACNSTGTDNNNNNNNVNNNTTIGKIEGDLVDVDRPVTAPYGELPDLEGVVIDGELDDEIWQDRMWYSQYNTTNRAGMRFTTVFSEKGLYLAAESSDRSIYWRLRNHFDSNTHFVFRIVTAVNTTLDFAIDANNLRPTSKFLNARSKVHGELNQMGKATGISAEIYITWDELEYESAPETLKIFPYYKYKPSESAALRSLLPTFMKDLPGVDEYLNFNDDGYLNGDEEWSTIGDHEIGLGKTASWIVEKDEEDNEIVSTNGKRYIYPQAIFFKEEQGNYFSLSARMKVNSASSAIARAGLLVYRDDIAYRSFALEITNDEFDEGNLHTLNVKGYTNHPSNVTVTTPFALMQNEKGDGRAKDEVDLLLFYDDGRIYYIVNGEYLHSEYITYTNNPYVGLYSVNSDVTFTNVTCDMYDNTDEIKEYISDYAYSVSVENVTAESTVSISQIGVSKKGNDSVTLSFLNAPGYTVNQLFYRDSQGNEYDILEDAMQEGTFGTYELKDIKDNITIYCEGIKDESETVDVKLFFYDSLLGTYEGMMKSVNFILTGSGAFTCYEVNMTFQDGIAVVPVPKGFSWKYETTFAGYRSSRGVVADGAILNEDMASEQYVEVVAPVVGGTATSPTSSNQVSSSIGNYWDISNEENGEVTFQTTNNRYSYVYFSGPTMSQYHVAYVEMTNETDPLAFTSLERDPAAGFIVHNGAENLAMIRYDGMRLVPGGMSNFSKRTDAGNLIEGYPGYIVNTSGGVMTGDPYISNSGNTVNRLAYNDRVDTTSLLMIRNNTTMYFYIADGSAGVTPDKLNFDKLEFLYSYENSQFGGEAAIGIGVTVSYNLRVKFSNYWLLSGARAMAFSNELITSTLEVQGNGKDNVRLSSDGMYETDGEIRIVEGSELALTVDSSIKNENKVAKLTVNGTTRYIMGGQSTVFTIPESGQHYVINCELVDAINVTGTLNLPTGVDVTGLTGKLYLGAAEQTTFNIASDATFSVQVPKNMAYGLLVTSEQYSTQKIAIPASSEDYNVGALDFVKLPFGGSIQTVNGTALKTSTGYTYSVNDNGVPVAHWYSQATINNIFLSLQSEPKKDAVVKFSFSRKNVASAGVNGTDETDLGIGVIMSDGIASHKILFMTTGYRIFDTSGTKVAETRGITTVNVGTTSVSQIDLMIVKRGSYVFMYSKFAAADVYQLVYVYHAKDNGVEVMSGECNFQFTMTSWPGRFLSVDTFNVSVEDLDPSKFPELITEVTLESEDGTLAVDTTSTGFISKAGNVYTVYKGLPLKVKITPDEGKILGAVIKDGKNQALSGYTGGEYVYNVTVDGPTTIGAEFLDADEVSFISGTVTDEDGKPMAFYTIETPEGYSASTDKDGKFKDLIAANASEVNFLAESVADYLALDTVVEADENGQFHIVVKKSILGGSVTVGSRTYYSGTNLWSEGTTKTTDHGYDLRLDENGNEIAVWDYKNAERSAIMFTGVSSDKLVVRASITWNMLTDMYPVAGFIFRDANGGKDGFGLYGETPNGTTGNIRSWYGGWKNATSPEAIPYRHVGNHQGISLAESTGKVDMLCVYDCGTYDYYVRFSGHGDDTWYNVYYGASFNGETKVNGGEVAVGLAETSEAKMSAWVWSDYSIATGQEAIDAFYYNNLIVVSGEDDATVEVVGTRSSKQLVVTPVDEDKQVTLVAVNGEPIVGIIDTETGAFTCDLPRCPEIGTFDVKVKVGNAEDAIEYTAKATIGGRNVAGVEVIFARDNNIGYKTTTNADGLYSVVLPEGVYTVYYSHEQALDMIKTVNVDGAQLADVNLTYGINKSYQDVNTPTLATYGITYDKTAEDQLSTLVIEQRSLNSAFALFQPIAPNGTLEFSFKSSEGHSYRQGLYSDLDEYYKWTISEAGGVNAQNFGITSSGGSWYGTNHANVFGGITAAYKDQIYHVYNVKIVRNGANVKMYHKLNDGEWILHSEVVIKSDTADYFMNFRNDGKAISVEINRVFFGFKYYEA